MAIIFNKKIKMEKNFTKKIPQIKKNLKLNYCQNELDKLKLKNQVLFSIGNNDKSIIGFNGAA